MGLTSTYEVQTNLDGTTTMTNVDPAGRQTVTTEDAYGGGTASYPDGTVVNTIMGPDPRFGMLAPVTSFMNVTTPGGLQYSLSEFRTANLSDPANPFSFTGLTDSVNVNGNTFTSSYDPSTGMIADTLIYPKDRPFSYNHLI